MTTLGSADGNADLTYSSYLRLAELLDLQQPQTRDAGPAVRGAEHLFIVTHQASELWVWQLLHDLDDAARALQSGAPVDTAEFLRRAVAVAGLLRDHLEVLATMPAHRFADFREALGTASGAQSRQFRDLDKVLGLRREPAPLLLALLAQCDRHQTTITRLLGGGADSAVPWPLVEVARLMIDVARSVWQWKVVHLQLVASMIGTGRSGTGGSSGTSYLGNRLDLAFPELFDALSQIQHTAPDHAQASQSA